MKIMLDKSPKQISEYSDRYGHEFWQLRTPLTGYSLHGCPYGLDNGCFSSFNETAWLRLVREAYDRRPIFVCVPDIVGSARRTLEVFDYFSSSIEGLPKALVLQDGIGNFAIPWEEIDAVFIGGSDAFKVSNEALAAARAAKILGKWVHVGRVNTAKRVYDWKGVADSFDGSGISRFDHMLEDVLRMVNGEHPQIQMEAM